METRTKGVKRVALVAHDNMKSDLAEWVDWNSSTLSNYSLVCTGTTGKMVEKTIINNQIESRHREGTHSKPLAQLDITLLKSGPLGGDQLLGSMIADGEISALIFFWDPMSAQPHDVDVKLFRDLQRSNVPTAYNRATADYMISSPLFGGEYKPEVKDYKEYIERVLR